MPGGGVLIIANVNVNNKNEKYYLIGREHPEKNWTGGNKWSNFGGAINNGESAKNGATREFYEETLGIFGDKTDYNKILHGAKELKTKSGYILYVAEINSFDTKQEMDKVTETFNNMYLFFRGNIFGNKNIKKRSGINKVGFKAIQTNSNNGHGGLFEKTKIKWIKEQELIAAINNKGNIKTNKKKIIYKLRDEFKTSLQELLQPSLKELFLEKRNFSLKQLHDNKNLRNKILAKFNQLYENRFNGSTASVLNGHKIAILKAHYNKNFRTTSKDEQGLRWIRSIHISQYNANIGGKQVKRLKPT